MQNIVLLSVDLLSVMTRRAVMECHFLVLFCSVNMLSVDHGHLRYAECLYAECRGHSLSWRRREWGYVFETNDSSSKKYCGE
jgi:hypothetical protein